MHSLCMYGLLFKSPLCFMSIFLCPQKLHCSSCTFLLFWDCGAVDLVIPLLNYFILFYYYEQGFKYHVLKLSFKKSFKIIFLG